jgi:monofunctional biosynthetic peptidoglycan transglycosylase
LLFIIVLLALSSLIFSLYFYLTLPEVSYLENKNPQTTALIELRKKQAKESGRTYKIRQSWVSFGKIPKLMKQTVRITEDAAFYQHEGVDYVELKESIKRNWREGRFARGASTITQQLAKNLYLSTEKSIFRKIREYFIARFLEKTLSKNRIFHLYLNIIEFGDGIFGVQAASRFYFNKNVDRLSLEEIIRLTAVIPKPLTENPLKNTGWLKWKCKWILEKLYQYGYITENRYRINRRIFK